MIMIMITTVIIDVTLLEYLLWAGPSAKPFLCSPHLICTTKVTQELSSHFTYGKTEVKVVGKPSRFNIITAHKGRKANVCLVSDGDWRAQTLE